jgi:hypothetical protein
VGIGNHELIVYEQDHMEELTQQFIEAHEEEWNEYQRYEMQEDKEMRVEHFCTTHEAWGDHVLEEYTNYTTGGH